MSYRTIYTWACEHPSKPAVIHNGVTVSYSALANAIGTTFDYLDTQELPEDHNVVVLIRNTLDCWVIVLALQSLGIHTVCVHSTELLDALALKNVAGIVTTEAESLKHQLKPDTKTGNRVIAVPNPFYISTVSPHTPAFDRQTKIGGHILYTSGTTGVYKKLFFSAQLQQKRNAGRPGYNANTVFHGVNFGLWTPVGYKMPLSAWHVGGSVILDQRPDWCLHLYQSGLTNLVLTPNLVHQLLDSLEEDSSSTSPLNFQLVLTSGFVSFTMAEKLLSRVTVNLLNNYASTETHLATLQSTVADMDDLHWLSCREGRTVEIVDESGNLCPINVEGELRIRLTELDCSDYMDDPEATARMFRDGYFYPGDMAVRRADGRIRILGRSADVVNFQGQKRAVAPMEDKIQTILGVNAVCLFSGIDSAGEEEVVIAMETEQWPEKSDLDFLGHEFAQFDQVRFAIVYPFPRTTTGTSKINRVALRKLVFPV